MRMLVAPLLLGSALTAQAADEAGTGRWAGSLDLGYTAIAGNSRSATLVAATQASRTDGNWTHSLEARGKNTEEGGVRTAEAYRLAGKEDYALSPRDYLFLSAAWDKDLFSGYDWQATGSAGYGRKLVDNERHQWSAEAGPGLRHDEFADGSDEQETTAHLATRYSWQVSASTRFQQLLQADIGRDNTGSRSLTELGIKLNARLALKGSVEIKRNSEPPAARASRTKPAAG